MRDLAEVFRPELVLPIRGKDYTVPAPDAGTGLRLTALWAFVMQASAQAMEADGDHREALLRALNLTDAQTDDFYAMALTQPVMDEMVADGLPWEYIAHAAETAWHRWVQGADIATAYWESGGKAVPTMSRQTLSTSTSTGEASTTPTPGYGTGTTSRPKSGKHKSKHGKKASTG